MFFFYESVGARIVCGYEYNDINGCGQILPAGVDC
jgi:hypothetical protein